jgi:hypothetical protein
MGMGIAPVAAPPATPAFVTPQNAGFSAAWVKIDTEPLRQLAAILSEASKALPPGYRVEATSSERPGATVAGAGGVSQRTTLNVVGVMH